MIELTDKRVLVTGGAGFIGSNLANELAAENEVVAVDDGYLGIKENLSEEVQFREQSVLDDGLPSPVDVVFHLAGLSSYAANEEDPCRSVRVNVEGFVNTVEQVREGGCRTVVYTSTSSIGGDQSTSPEDAPPSVNTSYEASKASRETYAEYFANRYDVTMAGMRLSAVYQGYGGTEGSPGDYANTIAQFADDIAHGRPPTIYGDGTQTRDFIHMDDVVAGLIAAAENRLSGIYGLGTGRSVSFDELIRMIRAELDADVDPEYIENPAPGDAYVHDARADYSKLHAETGWEPRIPLEDGLARLCAQYETPEP